MMKIAIVDPIANVGGGRRFTAFLTQALVQARPQWTWHFVTERQVRLSGWFEQLNSLPIVWRDLVTEPTLRQWFSDGRIGHLPGSWRIKIAMRDLLAHTLFRLETQIAHAVAGCDLAFFPMPEIFDYYNCPVPVVCTLHDLLWKHTSVISEQKMAVLDRSLPLWLRRSQAVVTITNCLRQDIQKFYPGLASSLHVIHQPAPILPEPLDGHLRDDLLTRWNIRGRFALCVGGIWKHKNHANLIRAFAELKRRHQILRLVCCGLYTDHAFGVQVPQNLGGSAQELRELCQQEGLLLGEDVIGVGQVNDVELATLYAASTMLVSAAVAEGGSFPMLEAAAQFIPIVCSDLDVYREQAELYGLMPIYFDPADSLAIANAIEKRLQSGLSWDVLVSIAQRVRARTWAVVAEEYLEVFELARERGVR
jgi:glycosyltransferase involved in cell wall biosynthesis